MSETDRKLWDRMLAYLRAEHPDICRQWFEEIEPLGTHGGTLHLRAQSRVHRDYLRRQCADAFSDAARNASGHLLSVMFLGPDEQVPVQGPIAASTRVSENDILHGDVLTLNPDYGLDTFVEGPGNRYAFAAAQAVARNPGKSYNPLFIHGGFGLGKTHLLQGVCLALREENPDIRILYLSCEAFVTHFTEAIRAGQMLQFRHWFRDVDVLVIDDIHFLSAKEGSQEEFFHTFNTLYQQDRQIILSSDAMPEAIPDLEERLVSRFKWGLVTEISPPDYETRVAILKMKARLRGMSLPDDVCAYIASRTERNIRELESAIKRLHLYAATLDRPIDLDLCAEALGDLAPEQSPGGPTIQTILNTVTDFYNVRLSDLQSRKRQRSIALPRQVCMYLARRHTMHSLQEIGGFLGGRDHTTVMHAVRAIEQKREEDAQLQSVLATLESRLTAAD